MNQLTKISLIISLLGILTLLMLINNQPIKQIQISEINNHYLNKQISIQGTLKNIKTYQTLEILTIQDPSSKIQVIAYNSNTSTTNLNKTLTIIGKIQSYNNQLEIIADKIIQ